MRDCCAIEVGETSKVDRISLKFESLRLEACRRSLQVGDRNSYQTVGDAMKPLGEGKKCVVLEMVVARQRTRENHPDMRCAKCISHKCMKAGVGCMRCDGNSVAERGKVECRAKFRFVCVCDREGSMA